jgi:hypothetical protein
LEDPNRTTSSGRSTSVTTDARTHVSSTHPSGPTSATCPPLCSNTDAVHPTGGHGQNGVIDPQPDPIVDRPVPRRHGDESVEVDHEEWLGHGRASGHRAIGVTEVTEVTILAGLGEAEGAIRSIHGSLFERTADHQIADDRNEDETQHGERPLPDAQLD